MSTPPIPPPGDASPPIPPPGDTPPPKPPAGSAPVQHAPQMQPMQMGGTQAKSGKGKLIGIIVGILVIVVGLIFVGITYGPGLWAKAKAGGGDLSSPDDEDGGLPSLTELLPGSPGTPGTISRKLDGLWYEDGGTKPYSGVVVFEEDTQRWEEKFVKGVRTHMRAWDEEGNPVQLHAWNTDGSPND